MREIPGHARAARTSELEYTLCPTDTPSPLSWLKTYSHSSSSTLPCVSNVRDATPSNRFTASRNDCPVRRMSDPRTFVTTCAESRLFDSSNHLLRRDAASP